MPLVSIIIPAYNSSATIGETLSSLAEQTFRDFEVIVVDDGSTDDTAALVECDFPSVHVIRQANGGPAAARNTGVDQATGEWIAFLDADDAWLPWRLSLQVDFASVNPTIDLWCGVGADFETPLKIFEQQLAPLPSTRDLNTLPLGRKEFLWSLTLHDLRFTNPIATSTVLIRKHVFTEVGGFDTRFRGPEDYDLWIRVLAQYSAVKINLPVSRYRQHEAGLSQDERKFLPEVLKVIDRAYGKDGALHAFGWIGKRQAIAYQMVGMAWVAQVSSRRYSALKLLIRSFLLWPLKFPNAKHRFMRIGLLKNVLGLSRR